MINNKRVTAVILVAGNSTRFGKNRNKNFEIVTVSEDHLAIPVGEYAATFHGVVTLSEAAAFLLQQLEEPQTIESLIDRLLNEYDIDRATAEQDVKSIVKSFYEMKLVLDA